MTIGLLTVELSIDGAFSLKDKRMVVSRIRDRVGRKFNAAIAEIDDNDVWNQACLGIVVISNEQVHANRMLSKIVEFIQGARDCELEDFSMEFL